MLADMTSNKPTTIFVIDEWSVLYTKTELDGMPTASNSLQGDVLSSLNIDAPCAKNTSVTSMDYIDSISI